MPAVATEERPVVATSAEYEAIFAPAPKLKTPAELFDLQVKVWMALGLLTPDEAGSLRCHAPDARNFLLVPDLSQTHLTVLMKQVVLKGKTGESYLDQQHLTDEDGASKGAHLLLDIRDGRERLNTEPSEAEKQIKKAGRIGFTARQGIAFGIIFPDVLAHHNLDLVRSRYDGRVPSLYRIDDGVPWLYIRYTDGPYPKWGAPCAGSAVGT